MFQSAGGGKVCFTRNVTTIWWFVEPHLCRSWWCWWCFRVNDSYCFLLLKNDAVNKRHLTRNIDVTRFCCQNCLLNTLVYHVNQHWVYFLAKCALNNRKSFLLAGEGVVAVSDVLLQWGHTFKAYLDMGRGVKIWRFWGAVIYGCS